LCTSQRLPLPPASTFAAPPPPPSISSRSPNSRPPPPRRAAEEMTLGINSRNPHTAGRFTAGIRVYQQPLRKGRDVPL